MPKVSTLSSHLLHNPVARWVQHRHKEETMFRFALLALGLIGIGDCWPAASGRREPGCSEACSSSASCSSSCCSSASSAGSSGAAPRDAPRGLFPAGAVRRGALNSHKARAVTRRSRTGIASPTPARRSTAGPGIQKTSRPRRYQLGQSDHRQRWPCRVSPSHGRVVRGRRLCGAGSGHSHQQREPRTRSTGGRSRVSALRISVDVQRGPT